MGNEIIIRDPAKLQEWAKRINSCKSSGETVLNWCHRNGINSKTYYYWNRKVMKMYEENNFSNASHELYEVPQIIDVQSDRSAVSRIIIKDITAEIYHGADQETLTAILKAMQQC